MHPPAFVPADSLSSQFLKPVPIFPFVLIGTRGKRSFDYEKKVLKLMPFAPYLRMHLLRLVEDSSARVEQHHLHTISVTSTAKQRHQIQSISGLARMC